ncbi:MAG: hypothetical protein JRG91_16090 [Deltaproteobacteria bacterium]|nr:hypothetical protein [Deltaproteobacteria bacterium]
MDRTCPGPASASGFRLLTSRRHEGLSLAGLKMIIERAEIMHEGGVTHDGEGSHYYGSTLFTLDIDSMSECLAGATGEETCSRLLDHLRAHPFFRVHLMRLARREVLRRVGSLPLLPLCGELRGRVEGRRILIDLDVEFHGLTNLLAQPAL